MNIENGWSRYCSQLRTLLVGEGNFSFSASMVRSFLPKAAENVTATCYPSKFAVMTLYRQALPNLLFLAKQGARVIDHVDATTMKSNESLRDEKFDLIVFNFPLIGPRGPHDISAHQALIRSFFKNAMAMLTKGGRIEMRVHARHPYSLWRVEDIASKHNLKRILKVHFKKGEYPGYSNKRTVADVEFSVHKSFMLRFEPIWNKNIGFLLLFSNNLKLGFHEESRKKEELAELLKFHSTKSDTQMISLKEYVSRMKEGQKYIYYITCNKKTVENSFLEKLKEKHYEVLLIVDAIDEDVVGLLNDFEGKMLVSVTKV